MRSFEDFLAKREAVPLLIGLYGPSGTGKTFSAHRLAAGIQQVVGGDIYGIDTEAKRMLHYADRFRFRHVPFRPPFGPLDYLDAIKHCVGKGAKIIIIDSFSHEHEGEGGVLEAHDREIDRLVKEAEGRGKTAYRDTYNMQAWIPVKRQRMQMIQGILQLGITLIGCFRAKEKVKPTKDKKIVELGWQPIGAEEIFYEMTVTMLLRPGCGGVPSWKAETPGEQPMIKIPAQFRDMLLPRTEPLSEEVGVALARWAAGDEAVQAAENTAVDASIAKITALGEAGTADDLARYLKTEVAPKFPAQGRHGARIGAAVEAARARIGSRTAAKKTAGLAAERRAALAEQAGVAVEVVTAVERFAGGNDNEETIVRALRAEKLSADEVQVAEIIAEIRKG